MIDNNGSFLDRAIGLKIRYARRQKFVLQEDLARDLGIETELIDMFEHGKQRVPKKQLYEIALRLAKPINWFYEMES